jgi:hypothetical protein
MSSWSCWQGKLALIEVIPFDETEYDDEEDDED